jgi:eukaryotic-like serine/threonine-protein kinase
MICRACGDPHEDGAVYCPRVGERTDRGPCGTQIDRYAVERLLGGGGMGAVYLAKHTLLGQPVALKLLKGDLAGKQDMVDRFVREARAAAAIGSPHIVRVTDVGTAADGSPFLVMELLDGQDVDALLKQRGSLPPMEAIDITLQVLDGLAAAHAAGIIHRDLKPANVYLVKGKGGKPVAKLVDFGISKMHKDGAASSLTRTGMLMGTPMYMAPEQLKSARDVDHRVDLYAAAVTLYQMVSGTLPYEATSYETLIVQIFTEPPKPIRKVAPGLNEALARVIEQGMAPDPTKRFASAAEFDAALRLAVAALGGAPALQEVHTKPDAQQIAFEHAATAYATPSSAPTDVRPVVAAAPAPAAPAPKSRAWLWALIAVVVLGGAATAVALSLRGREAVAIAATPEAAAPAPDRQTTEAKPVEAERQLAEAEKKAEAEAERQLAEAEKKAEAEAAALEKEPAAPSPPAPPDASPPPGDRLTIDEPRVVGDLSAAPLRKAFKAAAAELEECRPAKPTVVEVQFHVHGKITLAAAAPDNQGDPKVARCIANRIKEQSPVWPEDASGILFVVVSL